ncbi:hypothetical protein F5Y09DRAFT_302698 [Xylaria sp. FL1042]|nr:hypothetical protein F5Y09DRAFT_302698 [Xylaria sp. FL1042]
MNSHIFDFFFPFLSCALLSSIFPSLVSLVLFSISLCLSFSLSLSLSIFPFEHAL